MIKYILLISMSLLIMYLGYLFTKSYKKKVIIFNDLVKFCEICDLGITINKLSITKIIDEYKDSFSKQFLDIVDNYYLNKNFDYHSDYLSVSEEKIVKDFLLSLGKMDVGCELNNLCNNKKAFEKIYRDLKENKQKGMLGTKLGVLFGLIFFIVFV